MEAYPGFPPSIDRCITTVLSGTDLVGERCAKLFLDVIMAFYLINLTHRKHLFLVGIIPSRHLIGTQTGHAHSTLVALNLADIILVVLSVCI